MKWGGFILSEHVTSQEQYEKEQFKPEQKIQMTTDEINTVIQNALLKNLPISIQVEAIDLDGNYFPNVLGLIDGFDELGFYVNGTKVEYDEVRHVEIKESIKWFKDA